MADSTETAVTTANVVTPLKPMAVFRKCLPYIFLLILSPIVLINTDFLLTEFPVFQIRFFAGVLTFVIIVFVAYLPLCLNMHIYDIMTNQPNDLHFFSKGRSIISIGIRFVLVLFLSAFVLFFIVKLALLLLIPGVRLFFHTRALSNISSFNLDMFFTFPVIYALSIYMFPMLVIGNQQPENKRLLKKPWISEGISFLRSNFKTTIPLLIFYAFIHFYSWSVLLIPSELDQKWILLKLLHSVSQPVVDIISYYFLILRYYILLNNNWNPFTTKPYDAQVQGNIFIPPEVKSIGQRAGRRR